MVQANSGTLTELDSRCGVAESRDLAAVQIRQLIGAAPHLRRSLVCNVKGTPAEVLELLRDETVSVEVHGAWVVGTAHANDGAAPLWLALSAHASLQSFRWSGELDNPPNWAIVGLAQTGQLARLVDVTIRLRLRYLYLDGAGLSPDSLPELTRLVAEAAHLKTLIIRNRHRLVFRGDGVAPFCAALRSARITWLSLSAVNLWLSLSGGTAVLAALTNHPTITTLVLGGNPPPEETEDNPVGSQLAALVAADGVLSTLWLTNARTAKWGDAIVRSLFEAVARSTRLRQLDCVNGGISAECARDHLLPAVRANASLKQLTLYESGTAEADKLADLAAAEALVAARS